jgi:hypothetical protein
MQKQISKLMKLRGLGDVLARRLVEAGIESYEKIVAVGEEGLLKIKGMNTRAFPGILTHAEEIVADMQAGKSRREEELKQAALALREHVQGVAVDLKDRFSADIAGKMGRKVGKEIMKMIVSLEKVEAKLVTRGKRAAKGMAKAEKRLGGQQEAGLNKVRKGLQKARKSLKRVLV